MKICITEGCGREVEYSGYQLCKRCYIRLWRKGKLEKPEFIPNTILVEGGIIKIELCNENKEVAGYAIIDKEDYEHVKGYRWYKHISGYAYNSSTKTFLHQHIAQLMGIKNTDHINRDRSDNRKTNLREATLFENARNKGVRKNSKSGYTGVNWITNESKYRAYINVSDKKIPLGGFDNPVDAAKAYNEAAVKYFGEFACLNKLPGGI
jgi:hypothetical protein